MAGAKKSDKDEQPVSDFAKRVYAAVSAVPRGKVTTYKDIAHVLSTGSYRAVGQALRCNPFAPRVPCHRVVASDGSIGGFMGDTGGLALTKKVLLLKAEGVIVRDGQVVDFAKRHYTF